MSNSKVRNRRRRRERRFLGCDPSTKPWQFQLARYIRNEGATVNADWKPEAEQLTVEQRCEILLRVIRGDYDHTGVDISKEIL